MTIKRTPPILFIVFNRMDCTKRVFETIRKSRPLKLYISSDGPRENKENEAKQVNVIRSYLLGQIDWKCDLQTLFHDVNLGCKNAPHSAITWFFEHEEKGIVLEDDCLPSPSFFKYTAELLDRYEHNFKVYGISGINFQADKYAVEDSYYFSRFFMTWGWASWKTRWKEHLLIQEESQKYLSNPSVYKLLENRAANKELVRLAQQGYDDKLDAWDYQWILSCIINNGLIATPAQNLVENIGFGNQATHTVLPKNRKIASKNLEFPLKHPTLIRANLEIDDSFYRNFQGWLSTKEKLLSKNFIRLFIASKMNRMKNLF